MTPSEAQLDRARFIRTVLAWHDVNQADLARLLGCTQVSASRKLRGVRRFTDDELLKIAETFDLDPGYMLRPPVLEPLLGAVRNSDEGLLTCTFNAFPLVTAFSPPLRDRLLPLIPLAVIPQAA